MLNSEKQKTDGPDNGCRVGWLGKIEVYPEICCEFCNEIGRNNLDCPACGKKYASSKQYGELEAENGVTKIQCARCKSCFQTDGTWYDENAIWKRIA